jgi:hypothetical protein
MSDDTTALEDRLAAYRGVLDAAITEHTAAVESGLDEYVVATPSPAAVRRRWPVRSLGAVAATVLVALAVVSGGSGAPRSLRPAAPPDGARLLLELPGWQMQRVDEQDGGGEVTFANGARTFSLHWNDGGAQALDSLLKDRLASADVDQPAVVVGNAARLVRYRGGNEYVAVWAATDRVLEFRGQASSASEFETFTSALRPVSLDAWYAALPATTVTPEKRAAEVDRMLAGLPRPPGFDLSRLAESDLSKDRYQLGAEVAGAVACGWLDEWTAAKAAGDSTRVAAAVTAMQGSRAWPVLAEMNADGDYPEVVWQYADAVAGDGTVQGGKTLTVESSYPNALGCRKP